MKTPGASIRLALLAVALGALSVATGCGGGSSSTNAPIASTTYTFGAHTGTFVDGSNLFGHGTANATITYDDSTAGGHAGTIKFADGTTIAILMFVELEPSNLAFQLYQTGQTNPAVDGSMAATATTPVQYTGSGTEYKYTVSGGTTTPVAQPTAATITVM